MEIKKISCVYTVYILHSVFYILILTHTDVQPCHHPLTHAHTHRHTADCSLISVCSVQHGNSSCYFVWSLRLISWPLTPPRDFFEHSICIVFLKISHAPLGHLVIHNSTLASKGCVPLCVQTNQGRAMTDDSLCTYVSFPSYGHTHMWRHTHAQLFGAQPPGRWPALWSSVGGWLLLQETKGKADAPANSVKCSHIFILPSPENACLCYTGWRFIQV